VRAYHRVARRVAWYYRATECSHYLGLVTQICPTAEVVSLAPTFNEIVDEIAYLLQGRILVAHNLPFDSRMLRAEFDRLGRHLDLGRGFCTLQATKEKLSTACLNYGISNEAAHRAVTDARATALLLGKIFREDGALVPVQIEGSSARRSTRVFARPASQKEQAPVQMTLQRAVRHVSINGCQGSLLSYMDGLCSVLADMQLTAEERLYLNDWARELSLTKEQQAQVHQTFIESVVDAANRDSFISDRERDQIEKIAQELGVEVNLPRSKATQAEFMPGIRVCFTGQVIDSQGNELSREELHSKALALGYIPVESVTKKKCDLVVAADKSSMSGKAKKARDYGISVISVQEFLALVKN
jgi:DNA polymerase-3 subunit epsilon